MAVERPVPFSAYLQADYREQMQSLAAPEVFDASSPAQPVVVLNNGFPKPSSRQVLKTILLSKAAVIDVQVATATNALRVYFVGYKGNSNAGNNINIGDAASGSIGTTDGTTNLIGYITAGGVAVQENLFLPLPRQCAAGIRVSFTNVAGGNILLYWIEESLV